MLKTDKLSEWELANKAELTGISSATYSDSFSSTKLAGSKVKTWWMRQHPKVKSLPFKTGLKKVERVNARVRYIEGDMTEPELKGIPNHVHQLIHSAWGEFFTTQPEPLTDAEKNSFLKTLTGVSISSDAFFPFRDSIDQVLQGSSELH